ncbi:MAG: hypothetical protein ACRCX2_01840 [Paraclostridium sp.]
MIKHVKNELDTNKWLLGTTAQGKCLYEAVLTTQSIDGDYYGYSIEGMNHISGREFVIVDVAHKSEIEIKFSKFKIELK